MSLETFQLIQTLNKNEIDTQIALQCAPVITGIKIANLFIVSKTVTRELTHLFLDTQIRFWCVGESTDSKTYLIYHEKKLKQYLTQEKINQKLLEIGYTGESLEEQIVCFSKRYEAYNSTKNDFPHEMGLFLGYPLEDVDGFVKNNGKNCLYCGYWKVYHNRVQAKRLFQSYEKARDQIVLLLCNGICMRDIIIRHHIYSTHKNA